ncbi:MAG: hypothetical protein JRE73_13840 [Deltaproteobacteria bacterium]|nr:hypothetical protein [Deltaproteobacteria bacterium]
MAIVVNWNGIDVPEELKGLKKGRYVLLPMDEAPDLTEEQEAGLEAALASVQAGEGRTAAELALGVVTFMACGTDDGGPGGAAGSGAAGGDAGVGGEGGSLAAQARVSIDHVGSCPAQP